MKWVTTVHVHFDRVIAAWLIKRFVDKDASFEFLTPERVNERPDNATPFGMAGVELHNPGDGKGPTFHKIMQKYALKDPALVALDDIVTRGVVYVLQNKRPPEGELHSDIALGLMSIAEGILLTCKSDQETVDKSMALYDGVYALLQARDLMKTRGEEQPQGGKGEGMWQTLFTMGVATSLRPQGKVLGPGTTLKSDADLDKRLAGMRSH